MQDIDYNEKYHKFPNFVHTKTLQLVSKTDDLKNCTLN